MYHCSLAIARFVVHLHEGAEFAWLLLFLLLVVILHDRGCVRILDRDVDSVTSEMYWSWKSTE